MTAMTLPCPDAVETVLPGAPWSVSEARAVPDRGERRSALLESVLEATLRSSNLLPPARPPGPPDPTQQGETSKHVLIPSGFLLVGRLVSLGALVVLDRD